MSSPDYVLRLAERSDTERLCAIHEAAFRPLVEPRHAWDPEVQRARVEGSWAEGRHEVVVVAGEVVGQRIVDDRGDHVFLVRIMLDPRWQGRGLGAVLVRQVAAEAHARGLPLRLSVWDTNRARRLYARLGFAVTGQVEHRVQMELPPPADPPPDDPP